MKDMEIKTENRYEYRKTQEKRKQMIAPDLFEFAYVPDCNIEFLCQIFHRFLTAHTQNFQYLLPTFIRFQHLPTSFPLLCGIIIRVK